MAYQAGKLQFFAAHQALADPRAFADWLNPLRQCAWVVYSKRPFAGPEAVLAYFARAGTADGQYIARGCGCTDEGCRGCTPA